MAIFRFIALILLAAGLMLAGADIFTTLEGGAYAARSMGGVWGTIAGATGIPGPDSLGSEGIVGMIMGWPAYAILGGIGLVLALLFRRRD